LAQQVADPLDERYLPMRFSRFLQILAAILFLPTLAAHADTVTNFDFTGTYDLGNVPYTASGTVAIDTTTGAVQTIDLGFPTLSSEAVVADTSSQSYGPPLNFTEIGETWLGQPGINYFAAITLDIPVATLVGYTGGNICSLDNPCADPSTLTLGIGDNDFVDGTLSPTPEPSSWILVATGALAMVGVLRGRLLRA
jgi:hypothetical protein